jgi:hypothetical protein
VRALKRTIADSLESGARQLRYAMEQSGSLDEAFQKVYAAANAEQRIAVQQLELLLRSPESPESLNRHLRRSSYSTLAWLLHQTAAPEKSAAALLGEYRRQESFRATTLVALWSEFAGFLAYLGAVLAVLSRGQSVCGADSAAVPVVVPGIRNRPADTHQRRVWWRCTGVYATHAISGWIAVFGELVRLFAAPTA